MEHCVRLFSREISELLSFEDIQAVRQSNMFMRQQFEFNCIAAIESSLVEVENYFLARSKGRGIWIRTWVHCDWLRRISRCDNVDECSSFRCWDVATPPVQKKMILFAVDISNSALKVFIRAGKKDGNGVWGKTWTVGWLPFKSPIAIYGKVTWKMPTYFKLHWDWSDFDGFGKSVDLTFPVYSRPVPSFSKLIRAQLIESCIDCVVHLEWSLLFNSNGSAESKPLARRTDMICNLEYVLMDMIPFLRELLGTADGHQRLTATLRVFQSNLWAEQTNCLQKYIATGVYILSADKSVYFSFKQSPSVNHEFQDFDLILPARAGSSLVFSNFMSCHLSHSATSKFSGIACFISRSTNGNWN